MGLRNIMSCLSVRLIFNGSTFNFSIISDIRLHDIVMFFIMAKASCTSLDHFYSMYPSCWCHTDDEWYSMSG